MVEIPEHMDVKLTMYLEGVNRILELVQQRRTIFNAVDELADVAVRLISEVSEAGKTFLEKAEQAVGKANSLFLIAGWNEIPAFVDRKVIDMKASATYIDRGRINFLAVSDEELVMNPFLLEVRLREPWQCPTYPRLVTYIAERNSVDLVMTVMHPSEPGIERDFSMEVPLLVGTETIRAVGLPLRTQTYR